MGSRIKHDGFRFICRLDGGRTQVFTRRGHDWTDRVLVMVAALAARPPTPNLSSQGCFGENGLGYTTRMSEDGFGPLIIGGAASRAGWLA